MVHETAPFVGREADLRQLGQTLSRAAEGQGGVVLISGEAGIGKTRLCHEFRQRFRTQAGSSLLGRAAPEEAAIPFAALADALRRARRTEPSVWEASRSRAGLLWRVTPELASEGGVTPGSADR